MICLYLEEFNVLLMFVIIAREITGSALGNAIGRTRTMQRARSSVEFHKGKLRGNVATTTWDGRLPMITFDSWILGALDTGACSL